MRANHVGRMNGTDPRPCARMRHDLLQRLSTVTSTLVLVANHEAPKRKLGGLWRQVQKSWVAEHGEANKLIARTNRPEPRLAVKVGLRD